MTNHCDCCKRLHELIDEWVNEEKWVVTDSWDHGYGDAMYSVQYTVYGCQQTKMGWRCELLEGHDGDHYADALGRWKMGSRFVYT